MSFPFKKTPFILIIVFCIIEIIVGVFSFRYARSTEDKSLTTRAATIAASLETKDITALKGDLTDLQNPVYATLKQRFARIKNSNSDIRFVYLVGQRNSQVFFYLDNDPDGSEDSSPPGQIYTEASEKFSAVFNAGTPLVDGPYADRWGRWVSGIAPVFIPTTNITVAAVGIDIYATAYLTRIITTTLVPVFLVGILLLLVLIAYMRHQQDQKLLELKSRFVSIVSHDLHSPLRGIMWACHALLKNSPTSSSSFSNDQRNTISLIERASKNLSTLVTDLLDFSRIEQKKISDVSLSLVPLKTMLDEIIEIMILVAREKTVTLSYDTTVTGTIKIICDRQKIKEALSNFISNAIKYSDEHGLVTIGYAHTDNRHVISVTNTGKGIPREEQDKVFSSDFRASNSVTTTQGHGVGLYFSKQLVEAQQGTVRFQSVPGQTTTFFIEIPEVANTK